MSEFDGASDDTSISGTSSAVLDAPSASEPSGDSLNPSAASPTSGVQTSTQPGPVAYERFTEVNEKYGKTRWAEHLNEQTVRQRMDLADWIDRDPVGFHRYFTGQLQQHGHLPGAPQSQGQPQTADGPPPPDFQYRDEQGVLRTFYSAEQQQKYAEWQMAQLRAEVAPIQQREAQREMTFRAQQEGARILAKAQQAYPHFNDFKKDIHAAMEANPNLSLDQAYIQAVVPNLQAKERQTFAASMQEKASATTTSPQSAQPQGSTDLSKLSISQLFGREMRKRGMGR